MEPVNGTTPIRFTVQGLDAHHLGQNDFSACGAQTWTNEGNQTWAVRVETKEDPAACMRQLVVALAHNLSTVLVRPFLSVEIPIMAERNETKANGTLMEVGSDSHSSNEQQQQLSVLSIAAIAVGCTVALILLGFVFFHYGYSWASEHPHVTRHAGRVR
jgi:hypothetical protein